MKAMKAWLVGISALLSSMVYAYQYDVTQGGARIYASELFGAGSESAVIDYQGEGPKLSLRLELTPTEAAGLDEGDTASVTMTLINAALARNVRASDFTITPATHEISIRDRDDGLRGGNSITFEIVATGTLSTATGTLVSWELPPLTGLNPRRSVTAVVSVDAGGGSGFKSSEDDTVVIGGWLGGSTHRGRGGVLRAGTEASPVPLISFVPALTFQTSGGGDARIDLASGRTRIVGPGARAYLGNVRVGVPTGERLQLNGQPFRIGRHQDGQGELTVSVTGEFHESGDLAWLDLNGNHAPDSDELLSLRNGVMSGRFTLLEVAGDGRATGETEEQQRLRTEGEATRALIFRPNGVDGLRPATYTSTFAVDFNANRNVDKAPQATTLTTQYTAITAMRRASAIPSLGSTEVGNIRVKCEVPTDCPVYLECDDSMGRSWFVQLDDPIQGRTTRRFTSDTIATHLGISEAGWEGRLSCGIMSTADISVQVLTRSGGVLVNSTYIDD